MTEAQFPHIGAGLWQSKETVTHYALGIVRKPPETWTGKRCHLSKSLLPTPAGTCSHFSIGQSPDGSYVADFECRLDRSQTKGREMFSGDFGKRFTEEFWAQDDIGDGFPPDIDDTKIEWTYLGPCPPGADPH